VGKLDISKKTTIQVFGKGASIRHIGKVTVIDILSKDASVSLSFFNEVQPGKQVFTTHTTEENHVASLESLLEKYKNIFTGDGLLKDYEHKLHVKKSVSPVAQRLRRYPLNLRENINSELEKLLEKDFIEPVNQPSEWISNLVVTPKKDGPVRLCLDARAPNKAIPDPNP